MALTPYKHVNEFLQEFLTKVHAILGSNFIGMYLYGSLALGDFDKASSDLDILVVTANPASLKEVEGLRVLHRQIGRGSGSWAHRLEVSYAPRTAIRRYDPSNNRYPLASPVSPFGMIEHGKDWILNRAILREKGVVVAGPPLKILIDPVTPEEIRKTAKELLCEQWSKHVNGPDWMKPRKYQAFTVLTLCRMLYAMDTGRVATKPQAAAWAMQNLDPKWKPLIDWALAHRADATEGAMDDTLAFLRFVVESGCKR
jgi:predicted nucleotidyltransferase